MEDYDGYDPTRKDRAAAICPQVAAIISMIGSYIVIREVLVDHRQRRGKAIPRILFEMCIADLIFSSGWFLATWPSPTEADVWNNVGNTATCNFQAFLLQFGLLASPLFNITLAFFYLLMVTFNWTDAKLQKIEPWIHGGIWIFSLVGAIFPIPLGIYNNAWTVCWFESVPPGCKDSFRYGDEATCTRGDNAWIYAVAFTVFPVLVCVVLSFVIMGMIYLYVRRTERRMRRYAGSRSRSNATEFSGSTRSSSMFKGALRPSFRHSESSMASEDSIPSTRPVSVAGGAAETQAESRARPSYHRGGSSMASEDSVPSTRPISVAGGAAETQVESRARPSYRRAGSSMASVESSTSAKRNGERSASRSHVVAVQGIFYILSFVATYALHCFCTLVFFISRKYWYWLHLSMYFFLALQGFFNSLVFVRSRNMKTPEGRFFKKLVCCKFRVAARNKSARHGAPTDTQTTRQSTETANQSSCTNHEPVIPEETDSFNENDHEFVIPEETESINENDHEHGNPEETESINENDHEPSIPEETVFINENDHEPAFPEETDSSIYEIDHKPAVPEEIGSISESDSSSQEEQESRHSQASNAQDSAV